MERKSENGTFPIRIMLKSHILFCLIFTASFSFSQEKASGYIDAHWLGGNTVRHAPYVSQLITGHPTGFLAGYNIKTHGNKEWHKQYNYPDYGFSIQYVDFKNRYLNNNIAIGAHYNFYFLNRNLVFRVSQGLGIASKPYNRETNNKNNAFGSRILDNNYFMLYYQKQYLAEKLGIQAGFMLTHFSNGRFKAPNSGINVWSFNVGLNYNFAEQKPFNVENQQLSVDYKEPIAFNFAFRTGVAEAPVPHFGQKQFYHIGLYADKRLGRKSAIQLGTDVFFSRHLREYVKFMGIAFPELPNKYNPNADYKSIGIFAGHELFISRLSVETQFGYYVYKPFKDGNTMYQRIVLKYYLYKNWFVGTGLKTHLGVAEAAELTTGIRL